MSSEHYFYRRSSFRDLPTHEAGCKMPTTHTIEASDAQRRIDAEQGSAALLRALLRYFERHHWGRP